MAQNDISIVDFSLLSLERDDDDVIRLQQQEETAMKMLSDQLMDAFSTIGFAYLSNTGFPNLLLEQTSSTLDEFFNLPEETKRQFAHGSDNYGWVSSQQERLNPERPGDLKECFNVRLVAEDDPTRWPMDAVPQFKSLTLDFYRKCCQLTDRVLLAIAHGLQLPDKNFFTKCHNLVSSRENPSSLRCLHYPPLPKTAEIKENQVRLGEHCDYGTITLLFQRDSEGLQVQSQDGKDWIDAVPIPNTVLVNIADLLQIWTADKLRSTRHRVMIPEDEVKRQKVRRSIAFFVHPDHDVVVKCLDGSDRYPPVDSAQYLLDKLNATY